MLPEAADLSGGAPKHARTEPDKIIPVPEVRDYRQINRQLIHALDTGARHVRLAGVEGQRLLVSGLRGDWNALVEVDGRAGPELAADLDATGLTIVCQGGAADGAGRALRAGRLLVRGEVGDAIGYNQAGGLILATGPVGARAGLNQSGGWLALAGSVGRLAAERQSGGDFLLLSATIGPYTGWGRRGGRLLARDPVPAGFKPIRPDALRTFVERLQDLEPWLPEDWLLGMMGNP